MPTLDRSSHTRRFVTFATHVLFLVILFVLPELMMNIARPHRQTFEFYPGFYLRTLIYISAFYINYYILVDRCLGRPGASHPIVRLLIANILLITLGLGLSYSVMDYITPAHWADKPHRHLKYASSLLHDGVMMILTIGLAIALRLSAKWQDIDRQRQELLAEQRSTELDSLKKQLNPHFLFNTLNTIYALVDINPEDAKAAVHRLSGLLRYMLYEDVDYVELSRETDFIANFAELMRMRMSRRPINLDIDIRGHESDRVPPLLLLPLIENTFKYGNTARTEVPVSVRIAAEGNTLVCETENGFSDTSRNEGTERASGIGLANLKRRLALIYAGKATLTTSSENNIYKAKLTIPLSK
ncbi:MAG: histidine kinase [Bacteroidales bacterium]|nr:histidine kinase [Bacteroidales bacterium]